MKFKKASIFTTLVIAVLMVYALISLFVVHRQTRQLQYRAATLQQPERADRRRLGPLDRPAMVEQIIRRILRMTPTDP